MEEIVFHHTLPIQLRFNDVDKFGHVNNTVYFSFYDLGKTEYFASVCPGVDWERWELSSFTSKRTSSNKSSPQTTSLCKRLSPK